MEEPFLSEPLVVSPDELDALGQKLDRVALGATPEFRATLARVLDLAQAGREGNEFDGDSFRTPLGAMLGRALAGAPSPHSQTGGG